MKNRFMLLALLLTWPSMAYAVDTKLTALSAITNASADDLIYVADDPNGTPTSKKITVEDLFTSPKFVTPSIGIATGSSVTVRGVANKVQLGATANSLQTTPIFSISNSGNATVTTIDVLGNAVFSGTMKSNIGATVNNGSNTAVNGGNFTYKSSVNPTAVQFSATDGTIVLGSGTGSTITSNSAGRITFAGVGNTNNENLTMDFESTPNTISILSTTGVNTLDFNQNYIQGFYNPATVISTLAATTGSVTPAKSGWTYVLRPAGQGGTYVLLLPTAAAGLKYRFSVATITTLSVKAGASDKIAYLSLANGNKITSPATVSSVELIGGTNLWYVNDMNGTWTNGGA